MTKFIKLLALTTLIAVTATLFISAEDKPFADFIEAENCSVDANNACSVVDNTGAIGGKGITCTTAVGNNGTAKSTTDGFTLKFTVPKDGIYTVWGRVYTPNQTGNSLHYSVDGGDSQVWDMIDEAGDDLDCYGNWYYMYLTFRQPVTYDADSPNGGSFTQQKGVWRRSPNYLTLTKGEHIIHFTGREAGWIIDQFVITELEVEEYNPNYYEGNDYLFEGCSFCSANWKHYYKDIYAVKGITAESYFNNTLYPASSETADFIVIPATILGLSIISSVALKQKKRR